MSAVLQPRGRKTARRVAQAELDLSADGFFSRATPEPNTGCLLWAGTLTTTGYGEIRAGGALWLAHRVAYALVHGELAEGADLLHSCDQPSCVEPRHLRPGTQTDNNDDTVKRGRHVGGRGAGKRLAPHQVLEIRRRLGAGDRVCDLMRDFGICRHTVERIRIGRTWAALEAA